MKTTLITTVSIFCFSLCAIAQSIPPTIVDTSCMGNKIPYTSSTNPNELGPYVFSYNNNNPNKIGGPTNFDWVNTTNYQVYCTNTGGVVDPPHTFISPFYCNGFGSGNGSCSDDNTAIYTNITQDPFGVYGGNLSKKLRAMDILPEDGWELLQYSFGEAASAAVVNGVFQPNPFIWLYNRYTGKSKLFVAVTNVNLSTGLVTTAARIRFYTHDEGQYDLFAHAEPISHILSEFPKGSSFNQSYTNCDIISMNAASTSLEYYWLYSEFVFSYDPCTCRHINTNATKLAFEVELISISNVQLLINGVLSPVYNTSSGGDVLNQDPNKAISYGGDLSTLASAGKAALQGYKDWKEYSTQFTTWFNAQTNNGTQVPTTNGSSTINQPIVDMSTSFVNDELGFNPSTYLISIQNMHDLINGTNIYGNNPSPQSSETVVQKLAGLSPLVKDLASATPYIGAFISLADFFINVGSNKSKSNQAPQTPAPPTAYVLNGKIQGSITTSTSLGEQGFYLPGKFINQDFTQPKQSHEDKTFPIYNNPLGVLTLIDVPDFEYKEIPSTNVGFDYNDVNVGGNIYFSQVLKDNGRTIFCSVSDPTTCYNSSLFSCLSNLPPVTQYAKPFSGIYDYKLTGPIKYSLNPAANLSVQSIDACYVIEYDNTDPITIKNNATIKVVIANDSYDRCLDGVNPNTVSYKQIPYYPGMQNIYQPNSGYYTSYQGMGGIVSALQNEGFEIENMTGYSDPFGIGNASDSKFSIRTKYVPLQSIQSTDFILVGSKSLKPRVYLKLYCKFSKNNDSAAAPVTMVLTYDLSNKFNKANSNGIGGGANYSHYYIKDKCGTCYGSGGLIPLMAGDYNRFSNFYVYGAYYSPQYGVTGPATTTANSNGVVSAGDINIGSASVINPYNSGGYITFNAMSNINVPQDAEIINHTPSANVLFMASNNINFDKGLWASNNYSPYNNYYAGSAINFNSGYVIQNSNNFYAGNSILLSNSQAYNSPYFTNIGAFINSSNFYAKNEIDVKNTATNADTYIQGESVLSTAKPIPNIWGLQHGIDDTQNPIAGNAASNSDISSLCSGLNNRLMAKGNSTKQSGGTKPNVEAKKIVQSLGENPYKIGIYPNPTQGKVSVNVFSPAQQNAVQLSIEDLTGKIVFMQTLDLNIGLSHNELNLLDLANGVYFVKLNDSQGKLLKADKLMLSR